MSVHCGKLWVWLGFVFGNFQMWFSNIFLLVSLTSQRSAFTSCATSWLTFSIPVGRGKRQESQRLHWPNKSQSVTGKTKPWSLVWVFNFAKWTYLMSVLSVVCKMSEHMLNAFPGDEPNGGREECMEMSFGLWRCSWSDWGDKCSVTHPD